MTNRQLEQMIRTELQRLLADGEDEFSEAYRAIECLLPCDYDESDIAAYVRNPDDFTGLRRWATE